MEEGVTRHNPRTVHVRRVEDEGRQSDAALTRLDRWLRHAVMEK